MANPLYDPSSRDAQYGKNVAQYLLDLHDDSATFDFCGEGRCKLDPSTPA